MTRHQTSREHALADLLVSLFDASQLRQWVRLEFGQKVHSELQEPASLAASACDLVVSLSRHGRINQDLFRSLSARRPSRTDDIDAVAQLWVSEEVSGSIGPFESVEQTLAKRFLGAEGRRLLRQSLLRQPLAQNSEEIAEALASESEILGFASGAELIRQSEPENHLLLLLAGRVTVSANNREIVHRVAGQCVGEMALIDPSACRSATVIATEPTVAAKITEPAFSRLADRWPHLWRVLALELAERLREWNAMTKRRNTKPTVFIGSGTEMLWLARAIQTLLERDDANVRIWIDDDFTSSAFAINTLQGHVNDADFAVLVVDSSSVCVRDPDDPKLLLSRDHALLQLGMLIGVLTTARAFVVMPHDGRVTLPPHLIALTPIYYSRNDSSDDEAIATTVCNTIHKSISELGTR